VVGKVGEVPVAVGKGQKVKELHNMEVEAHHLIEEPTGTTAKDQGCSSVKIGRLHSQLRSDLTRQRIQLWEGYTDFVFYSSERLVQRALVCRGGMTFVGQPETAFDVAVEAATDGDDSAFHRDL